MPEAGDLQVADTAAAPPLQVPGPDITCRRDEVPVDCVTWSRDLAAPAGSDGSTGWVVPAGDRLLLPGSDALEAADTATGTRLWRREDLAEVYPMDVRGDLAVVQTHEGGEGVGLLDLTTGDHGAPWRGQPMLWGDLLYEDLVLTPPDDGGEPGIVARGVHDGVARWRWSTSEPFVQVLSAGHDDLRLVVLPGGGGGGVVVLDRRNGNELGRADVPTDWVLGVVDQTLIVIEPRDGTAPAGPDPAGDGGAVLRGVSTVDAAVQWERPVQASEVPFGLADGVVLVPSTGLLSVVDAATGAVAWEIPLAFSGDLAQHGPFFGSPVETPGVLPSVVLLLDQRDGQLVAHDVGTGEVMWRRHVPDQIAQATITGDRVWVDRLTGFDLIDAATGRSVLEVVAPGVPVVSLDPLVLFHPVSGTVARLDPDAEALR